MTITTTCFIWLGAGVLAANLVKLLSWLDTPPRKTSHRAAVH